MLALCLFFFQSDEILCGSHDLSVKVKSRVQRGSSANQPGQPTLKPLTFPILIKLGVTVNMLQVLFHLPAYPTNLAEPIQKGQQNFVGPLLFPDFLLAKIHEVHAILSVPNKHQN